MKHLVPGKKNLNFIPAFPQKNANETESEKTSHANDLKMFLKKYSDANASKVQELQSVIEKAENEYGSNQKPARRATFASSRRQQAFDPEFSADQTRRSKDSSISRSQLRMESSLTPKNQIKSSFSQEGSTLRNELKEKFKAFSKQERSNKSLKGAAPEKQKKNTTSSVFKAKGTAGFQSPQQTKPTIAQSQRRREASKSPIIYYYRRNSLENDEDNDNDSTLETEDFLMITPIRKSSELMSPQKPEPKSSLILDQSLFSPLIVNFAQELTGENIKQDFLDIVKFMQKNKEECLPKKLPKSEMLCSIYLKSETRSALKKLLKELVEQLHEEPISLRQKYKEAISFIRAQYFKLTTENLPPHMAQQATKFAESELQKLSHHVMSIQREDYLIFSKHILNQVYRFLMKLLEKFIPIFGAETFKPTKKGSIDYITLPKLFEKILESQELAFCRQFLIYTYDHYLSPSNLLLYLIYRYIVSKPCHNHHEIKQQQNTKSVPFYSHKLKVLRLTKFWLEERVEDFTSDPNLFYLLGVFLDLAQSSSGSNQEDPQFLETLSTLSYNYKTLAGSIQKQSIRSMRYSFDINGFVKDELLSVKDLSLLAHKKTSAMTAPSFFFQVNTDDDGRQTNDTDNLPPSESFAVKRDKAKSLNVEKLGYKTLLTKSSDEIARQLTLIDAKQFSKINVREMIAKRWMKKDKSQSPGYQTHVDRFNCMSYWIQFIVLSSKKLQERNEIVKKFLDIATICVQRYRNYCSPHYIFAAIVSLKNFEVISFEGIIKERYEMLRKVYVPDESYVKIYEKIFREIRLPSVPSLTIFLRIFLKIQDGVAFKVNLPSSTNSYLKFTTLLHLQDYCTEMRKFQRNIYQDYIEKDFTLYAYLKKGFKDEVTIPFHDPEESMEKVKKMVDDIKSDNLLLSILTFGLHKKLR